MNSTLKQIPILALLGSAFGLQAQILGFRAYQEVNANGTVVRSQVSVRDKEGKYHSCDAPGYVMNTSDEKIQHTRHQSAEQLRAENDRIIEACKVQYGITNSK